MTIFSINNRIAAKGDAVLFTYFKGKIESKSKDKVVLDVNNIGYEFNVSFNTLENLPEIGESTKLFVNFIVREDSQILYGFSSEPELELFKGLLKVSGIGPKMAISILSCVSAKQLYEIITNKNVDSLVKVPGVGKKTAERIIIELQGKFQKILAEKFANFSELTITSTINLKDVKQNAISALVSLGYKQEQAQNVVNKTYKPNEKEDEIIRKSLQILSGNLC